MRSCRPVSVHPLAIAIALSASGAIPAAFAAPIGVPCPSFPGMGDPTHKPVSYLCGVDVLAEDMWIGESLEAYDATIRTLRSNGIGLHLQRDQNGYLLMDNVDLLMDGDGNTGIVFSSMNPRGAQLHDLRIGMRGERTTGIDAGVTLPGPNGELVQNNQLLLQRSRLDVEGRSAIGLISGVNSGIVLDRSTVAVRGDGSIGIGQWAGDVQLLGSQMEVTGQRAVGVHAVSQLWTSPGWPARSYTPQLRLQDSTITAGGEGSIGILAEDRDRRAAGSGLALHLFESRVQADGGDALRVDGGVDNALVMQGGLLQGRDASVHLRLPGTRLRASLVDARLSTGTGSVLRLGERTGLQLHADGSVLEPRAGGVLASLGDQAEASLQLSGTRLRGGVQRGIGARLDAAMQGGSRWDLSAGGVFDQLLLEDSTVSLADGRTSDRLHVLGDLHLQNGRIALDTVLEGDGSASDQVRVDGRLSGHGLVFVHNAGGRGAPTGQGIALVSVGGASEATLTLGARAVGGVYEYFLHRDAGDGGWYLRSERLPEDICQRDPALCRPPEEGGGAEVGLPPVEEVQPPAAFVVRPEAGAYLASQLAAVQLTVPADHPQREAASDPQRHGWARWESGNHRLQAGAGQLALRGQRNRLQLGTRLGDFADGRGRVGMQASIGQATSQATSQLTSFAAEGRVRAVALGIGVDWVSTDQRSYVATLVQRGQYQTRIQGQGLQPEQLRGRSTLSALELGHRFELGRAGDLQWTLQPQAALHYRDTREGRHVERNGTQVQAYGNDGLSTRLGLRVQGQGAGARATVSPYLSLAVLRDAARGGITFDDVALQAAMPRNRREAMLGTRILLGERVAIGGGLGVSWGSGHYREVSGELGLTWRW